MKNRLLVALFAMTAGTVAVSGQEADDYFVSTNRDTTLHGAATAVRSNMTPEELFLHDHFTYRAPADWAVGTKFMVVPAVSGQYVSTFFDRETDREVPVASLSHSIMEYRGHGTSLRGRTQLYFYSYKLARECYHEVRNLSFEAFSGKPATGVPALAYLPDVDMAREMLLGKELWTKTDQFMVDDASSATGYNTVHIEKNTAVKVEKIGVGTREFPVKIVFSDPRGNLYFQYVCMSRTNSGLRDEQLAAGKAKNAFENSFLFSPMTAEEYDRSKARPDALTIMNRSAATKRERSTDNDSGYRTSSWADMVGGRITKGMTPDDVVLCKGLPNRRSGNNVNGMWRYDDGTTVVFKNGMVSSVKRK